MSGNMQEILQERAELTDQQADMVNKAIEAKKGLTGDEQQTFDNMDARIAEIENLVNLDKNVQSKLSNLDESYNPVDINQDVNNAPQDGFSNIGEFLIAVAGSTTGDSNRFPGAGQVDPRLTAMSIGNAATGHGTTVPSDGGFLVTPTRADEIMKKTYEGGAITSRCSTFDVTGNSDSLEVPFVDEDSRVNGSRWGGLRAYRKGEAESVTASKTKLGLWECRVADLEVLTYVTDRQLADGPALTQLINELVPQEFTFKMEDEILNGNGAAQMKGIIGDTATVSVAKETGQAADTIVFQNIVNMWARAWGRSRGKGNWFWNQDIEPQLHSMSLAVGTGGVPVYMPANGLSGTPFGTLMGRPGIAVEQAATLGDVGDIFFGDFSEYALVRKGGLNAASSIHVRFLQGESTFKFTMRNNGKPKWKNVLTPFKGGASKTLSPFVTLAERT